MKKFILNIHSCDKPSIEIMELVKAVQESEINSEVSILVGEANNITAKLRNCVPGSIEFICRVVNISEVKDIKTCSTGYLDRTQNEGEEPVSTVGVCLFATNINEETFANEKLGNCSMTVEQILERLIHARNFANSINIY